MAEPDENPFGDPTVGHPFQVIFQILETTNTTNVIDVNNVVNLKKKRLSRTNLV